MVEPAGIDRVVLAAEEILPSERYVQVELFALRGPIVHKTGEDSEHADAVERPVRTECVIKVSDRKIAPVQISAVLPDSGCFVDHAFQLDQVAKRGRRHVEIEVVAGVQDI